MIQDTIQETVDDKVNSAVNNISDKVSRVEQAMSDDVSNITHRMEALEKCLAENKHPVPVNHSEVRGECHDQGRGVLSPYANEFTPVKSAASDSACVRMPVRKKPQEFDGKVSWEAYRAQFELLAGQNHWDDQECAVQLATSLKGAAVEVLA